MAFRFSILCLLVVATSVPVSTISAQQAPEDSGYDECAAIKSDKERLACFDATYARIGSVKVQTDEEIQRQLELARARARENFGLSPELVEERAIESDKPRLAVGLTDEERDDITIVAKVEEVLTDSARKSVVILDNGQVWRELSNSSFRGRIRPGWTAEVKRSWSKGYRMTFAERKGFLSVRRMK